MSEQEQTLGGGPVGAMLTYQVLCTMLPDGAWAGLPEPVVKALADGAQWQFSSEAKERKEGASWYPTANPEVARRTGQYVNAIAHARLPVVRGVPYALTLRHESDEMLMRLLDVLRRRARREIDLRHQPALARESRKANR